jgi:DNA phosphorothioation-dependent restriction protein DptH
MPKKVTPEQRQMILRMLAQSEDRETIAAAAEVTPGQVSAIAAHVKMGTYELPVPEQTEIFHAPAEMTTNLLRTLKNLTTAADCDARMSPILLGADVETGEDVMWNPDPASGSQNPHVLILGESGTGKTYAISAMLAELARGSVSSAVFDYGQGFSPAVLPREFAAATDLVELHVGRDGVDVNPLQIFPSDLHGPVNVAQRVADTFARVYRKMGVQQHAVVRQAVLEVMEDAGITPDAPKSWSVPLPGFSAIHAKLRSYAADPMNPLARYASSAASHVSTVFVFNTFRPGGEGLAWNDFLSAAGSVAIIQLKGLEHSLERAVTEFLLWHLIGYVEALGPGPLRCFIVLDEAHKLSFDRGSPVEKLLREGRKFGLGLILASQQPEDFSPVAFANTATKIVFQVGDERSTISRQLHRKIKNSHSFGEIYQLITRLPRGSAYVVTENVGRVVRITEFSDRLSRWSDSR